MKFFTLIEDEKVHIAPDKKVVPAKEFSKLVNASEIVKKTKKEDVAFRTAVAKECEALKEQAELMGFEEGLNRWNAQIELLEEEIKKVRHEMENAIVPLALTAVRKMIGKELETKPETIVDVVATALKTVSQHRKVSIYVDKSDVDLVENERPRIKELFENLESLSIAARKDVQPGGCIIETEAGIINAQLENQLKALEAAFRNFFQKKGGKA